MKENSAIWSSARNNNHTSVSDKTSIKAEQKKSAIHNCDLFQILKKMAFKILSKKNGKRTVSDDKSNDTITVTKVLQFLTEGEPKEATI